MALKMLNLLKIIPAILERQLVKDRRIIKNLNIIFSNILELILENIQLDTVKNTVFTHLFTVSKLGI